MNIMNRLTLRQLKENKKRTLITIIGTIISAAMITAVATLGLSFFDLLQRDYIANNGEWHVAYKDINHDQLNKLKEDQSFQSLGLVQEKGYAYITDSTHPFKPYFYVRGLDDNGMKQFQINLLEGKLPQSSDEVVISAEFSEVTGVDYKIGDTVQLEVGERYLEGFDFSEDGQIYSLKEDEEGNKESLINLTEERFTIVGIIEKPTWDYPWAPGISLLTYVEQDGVLRANVDAYVILKKPNRSIFDDSEDKASQLQIADIQMNYNLLRYYGLTPNQSMHTTIYGLLAIIIVIIVIGSVALIFNAFAISVSERSRHLGMLSSVGATKRQKRNSVYFEGFVIGCISIPIGIISGLVGIGITFIFINRILEDWNLTEKLQVVFTPGSLLVAVAIASLTIFISTYIPARRASRITAIDAIRQTQDVKLSSKAVKTNKLVRKLFGVEADISLKNLKRNKKRYQVTVFSLAVSIVLFLSVSFFTDSFQRSIALTQNDLKYDLAIYTDDKDALPDLVNEISNLETVTSFNFSRSIGLNTWVERENLLKSQLDLIEEFPDLLEDNKFGYYVSLTSLDAASFSEYAQLTGTKLENLSDVTNNPAIVIDTITYEDSQAGKYVEGKAINTSLGDKISLSYEDWETETTHELGSITVVGLTSEVPAIRHDGYPGNVTIVVSDDTFEQIMGEFAPTNYTLYLISSDPMQTQLELDGIDSITGISNPYEWQQRDQQMLMIMKIFSYGFITLITLISIANIFNTISTSIALRKREFAVLKSIGMTPTSFNKMIYFESIFYGLKALLYGLPASILIMYGIHRMTQNSFSYSIVLPWGLILFVIMVVFLIVAAAMLYSVSKVKNENIIDALKQENI